jgi:ubiquinone/menaquinone biosynthesis C-methylase UbiE
VLEVGCGPGFFSPSIRQNCGQLVLLDLQPSMLRLARDRVAAPAVVADASALPFAGGSFDAVLLLLMLGEVPSPDACIAAVARVLRPGGLVAVAETRRDSDFIAIRSLRSLTQRHGFSFVARRGIAWEYTALFLAPDLEDAGGG